MQIPVGFIEADGYLYMCFDDVIARANVIYI